MAKRNIDNYLPPVKEDGLNTAKSVTALNNAATVAGGNPTPSFQQGVAAAPNYYYGSGAPTITAPQGSLYLRTDGSSTSTRLYVNTNGTTGWTAVTTVA